MVEMQHACAHMVCVLFNFVGAHLGGSTLKSEAKITLALARVTFNLPYDTRVSNSL